MQIILVIVLIYVLTAADTILQQLQVLCKVAEELLLGEC